ncbi:MAG: hypothetical protein M1818_002882 [Claussenomyces sp. TS43310]|nr:MAG: hypothetical protein M1818_002882 [Claussenomyces sp. TS43310]
MASLIPILKDIVPMLHPGPVQVTRSTELQEATAQTSGMIRKGALEDKCDKLCASDTIIYALRGHGCILTNSSLTKRAEPTSTPNPEASGLQRIPLAPGDFALIPAWTEHQEVNEGDDDVEWIITRSGSRPVAVNLEDWGGARRETTG